MIQVISPECYITIGVKDAKYASINWYEYSQLRNPDKDIKGEVIQIVEEALKALKA